MAHTHHQGVSEQAKVSKHRLDDARVLSNGDRWRGSMYMAGYAIECLLKAKLMRMYDCKTLTDLEDELRDRKFLTANASVFTHQLEILMSLTQCLPRLRKNPALWMAFSTVNRWVPAWRYNSDPSNSEDAQAFLDAVDSLLKWIENNV